MENVGFLGIDQYGEYYQIKKHPRKELLEQIGSTKASKMYRSQKDNKNRHVGYIIKKLWIEVFTVSLWKKTIIN